MAELGGDPPGHAGFLVDPLRADGAPQVGERLVRAQHVQPHLRTGQPGQRQAAGDEHRAAPRVGQQGPDLVLAVGVVEHDQQPPPGRALPVDPFLARQVGGDGVPGHAEQP